MRRRMYYAMPDHASARRIMDDLLLARVEERHIHFLAKPGTSMDGLHEANVLQKTDLVHGAQQGMVIGALLGCVAGGVLVFMGLAGDRWQIVTVIGAAILGALLGTWVSSMVGSAIPNSRLRQFDALIDSGGLLLMIDVPEHQVERIRETVGTRHPEAEDRGLDPHIPVFP